MKGKTTSLRTARVRTGEPLAGAHPRLAARRLRRLLHRDPAPRRSHGRVHRAPRPPRGPRGRGAPERDLRQRGRAHHRLHGPARGRDGDRQGLAHRLDHRQHADGPRPGHAPRGMEAQGAALQPHGRGDGRQHDAPGGGGARDPRDLRDRDPSPGARAHRVDQPRHLLHPDPHLRGEPRLPVQDPPALLLAGRRDGRGRRGGPALVDHAELSGPLSPPPSSPGS